MASGDKACGGKRGSGEGWEASIVAGSSAYHGDVGSGSDDHSSSGDLLHGPVRFVPAGGPSREYDPSLYSSSLNSLPRATTTFSGPAPTPGSLASNPTVANMMTRMNYKMGSGLGKHEQGITTPITVTARKGHIGLGSFKESYDNGLPTTDKRTNKWDAAGGATEANKWGDATGVANASSYYLRFDKWDCDDEDGSRKEVKEFCEGILAKMRARSAAAACCNPPLREDLVDAQAVITEALTSVQEKSSSGKLTTGDLIYEFTRLKEKFPEVYMTHRLADTAGTFVAPLLRPVFSRWNPLWDPTLWLDVAVLLKNVLDDGAMSAMSPYAELINGVVVPAMQASKWKATHSGSLIYFLESWKDTLPPSTVHHILEQVVVPELTSELESWDPRCPWSTMCYVFLHPWIPLIGRPWLESLCATVQSKLEPALREWGSSHAWVSNFTMVKPWKDLFNQASWEEFFGRNVVPNMRHGLEALQITPPKQSDDTFSKMMEWASLVPTEDMVRVLLEAEFFIRWLDALCRWLRAARPAAGEAMEWCSGWKRLFTPELLADERVLAPLDAGIDMAKRSAQGPSYYAHAAHAM